MQVYNYEERYPQMYGPEGWSVQRHSIYDALTCYVQSDIGRAYSIMMLSKILLNVYKFHRILLLFLSPPPPDNRGQEKENAKC